MNPRFGMALIVLALGQTLFLGAMIWDRVTLLRSPDVVTLKTAPIDPRDIFRGYYVILSYEISQLPLDKPSPHGATAPNPRTATRSSVGVSLTSSKTGWSPAPRSTTRK